MRLRLFFLLACFARLLSAQPDSSLLLTPEHLSDKDILTRKLGQQKLKAVSATRSLEDLDQLPFTVWVVTADDIAQNGFVTLGDVLRAAPGIRVSQPGNALQGETFMVRGLLGNEYMKILINDVPVTPSVALGMPLGAQLPIRQAERIEVLYGPAAAIYGDGACAGVVNIILKETERPIFTQADLAFGNLGYNNLDVMLGGKLFKDQKIFRFSLYGSNTVREQTDIFYDDKLFTPNKYLPFGLDSSVYRSRFNYRPRETEDSVARTAQMPHESRLLGISLTWRNFHFNYNRMQRFDHTSLGLSPLAVSYGNPSNRIAEQIESFAFRLQKQRARRKATHTLSILRYLVNNTSTFTPVFDRLSAAMYYAKLPEIQSPADRQFVLDDLYQRYASDERYFVANGLDIRWESYANATLRPNFYLNTGIQVNLGGGTPPMGYFLGPTQVDILGNSQPQSPKPFGAWASGNFDLNGFAQLHWRGKKTTLIGGVATNLSARYGFDYAPRLAALYRVDSAWSVRLTYAGAFRRPSVYSEINSFYIDVQSRPVPEALPNGSIAAETEQIRQAEFGVRRFRNGFTTDLQFFYQEGHNLARNGYLTKQDNHWYYGFGNAPGLSMALWGIEGTIGNDFLDFDLGKNKRPEGASITGKIEYYFQYSRGREWFGYGLPSTRDVRNYPRWITQFRLSFRAQKWDFMLSVNRQNAILSGAVVYRELYQLQPGKDYYPAYRTWDFRLRVHLSKNFLLFLHSQNAFNQHHAGIDATGTPDDLLYNPQQGRLLRFGVNYNMN